MKHTASVSMVLQNCTNTMELCLQYITRPDSGHSIYVTIKIPCTVFKELSSPQKSGSDLRLGAIHL